jgi:hypothetical protein
MAVSIPRRDSDASKGATDQTSLSAQISHRESDLAIRDFIDGSDSDFPEPGSNPEHSGEKFPAD